MNPKAGKLGVAVASVWLIGKAVTGANSLRPSQPWVFVPISLGLASSASSQGVASLRQGTPLLGLHAPCQGPAWAGMFAGQASR